MWQTANLFTYLKGCDGKMIDIINVILNICIFLFCGGLLIRLLSWMVKWYKEKEYEMSCFVGVLSLPFLVIVMKYLIMFINVPINFNMW
jgi:hypothetical protein